MSIKYIQCIPPPIETKFEKTTLLVIPYNALQITSVLKSLNLNPLLSINNFETSRLISDELIYDEAILTSSMNTELELVSHNALAHKNDIELLKNRIRQILNIAYYHGHDAVVIKDDGINCPEYVSYLYDKIIREEYVRHFEVVAFVFEKNDNYEVFKRNLIEKN